MKWFFEWMIGEFFHNQISIQKGDVLFNSQLLDKEININDTNIILIIGMR